MFLTPEENALMRIDFHQMLEAADPVDVVIRYEVPINPVIDPVYGTVTADSWESKTILAKAIQQYIRPRDHAIRQWGILEVGDCIFWISEFVDVTLAKYDTIQIETGGQIWRPVHSEEIKNIHELAIFRSQLGQISQMIPAKLRP